ncbi:hypothetical protein J7K99_04485, partial [bacterium]|nr:hypothetical protein [bacterium]
MRFWVVGLQCFALLVFAEVPRIMNYQGKITTSEGIALNGTDTIAFCIYDTSEGGTPLWGETLAVNIVNGLFDVMLGNTHPINLDFSEPYWMELSISTDGGTTWETFSPREKLAPVSFAYRSIYADTAEYAAGSGGNWTLTGNNLYPNNINWQVGIGTSTPDASAK